MARRRRTSLAKRLIVRPVRTRVARKRAARKRRQAQAAKLWTTTPLRGVKVPRTAGGGRIVPWSASEAQIMQARRAIKAQAAVAKKGPSVKPGGGLRVASQIRHGTNAGYHAHLADHSPACPACLKAHAAYNRAQRGGSSSPSRTPKADAAFAKLKALRESGYKGPIDELGNKTTEAAWKKRHGLA